MADVAKRAWDRDRIVVAVLATATSTVIAVIGFRELSRLDRYYYQTKDLQLLVLFCAAFFGAAVARVLARGQRKWSLWGALVGMLCGVAAAFFALLFALWGFFLMTDMRVQLMPDEAIAAIGISIFMGAAFAGVYWGMDTPDAGFWIGMPLIMAVLLFSPPAVISRFRDFLPRLPDWLDRFVHVVSLYPATLFAVGLLIVAVGRLRALNRRSSLVSTSACFLPTYVAGIESLSHLVSSMSGDWIADADILVVWHRESRLTAVTLLGSLVIGIIAAWKLGHRSRLGIPIPAAVGATLAGVALSWWLIFRLLQPL